MWISYLSIISEHRALATAAAHLWPLPLGAAGIAKLLHRSRPVADQGAVQVGGASAGVDGSDALLQNPGGASGPGFQSFNASRTPTIYGNGSAGRTNGNSTGSGQSGVVFIKW